MILFCFFLLQGSGSTDDQKFAKKLKRENERLVQKIAKLQKSQVEQTEKADAERTSRSDSTQQVQVSDESVRVRSIFC